jgi:ketosteroid isomerase-like protein
MNSVALTQRIVGSNDEKVVVLYRQRGQWIDGRSCDCEVLGLYRLLDGKVVRLQMFYFDPVLVAEFLGSAAGSNGWL